MPDAVTYDKLLKLSNLNRFKVKQDEFNEGKFAPKTDFDTVKGKVDTLETAGGQPNVIETVMVNGMSLSVREKAVDITVPTDNASLGNSAGYQTAADVATAIAGKADSADLGTAAAAATESTLTDGSNLPTGSAVKSFVEGQGYQTASDVQSAIGTAIATAMDYKGVKATKAELPASDNKQGDVWHVTADGSEYAWNGEEWEELGVTFDPTGFVQSSEITVAADDDIDALFASE